MTVPFQTPGESLQRLARVYREYTDQHGREFTAQADVRTNQPIGELTPQNDGPNAFSPPWLPPMRFAKFRKDGELKFRWDYNTMANELAGDTANYYTDARKIAIREKLPIPEVGGMVDPLIRDVLERPPLSPAIPLACEQGDPWILGVPGAPVNTMLKEILEQGVGSNSKEALAYIRNALAAYAAESGIQAVAAAPVVEPPSPRAKRVDAPPELSPTVTYPQFFAECRRRGMAAVEIAAAWKEQKELMGVA